MYRPAAFELDDDSARALIAEHPLAQLVVATPTGLQATPVPLIVRGDTLVGHFARPNELWQHPGPALAIFTGVDGYVSPNWYPSKHEHGKAVPTWNYETVHVRGTLVVHDDHDWKLAVLAQLTDWFERTSEHPWRLDDAPTDYIEAMIRGVVGIELTDLRIEAKSKLSQNRAEADRQGVIAGLSASTTNHAVADRMLDALMPDSGT